MRRKPFPLMQKAIPVVKKDEFIFAAVSLEHAHIYNMCHGLIDAGATLKWVYDSDLQKVAAFMKEFPQAKMANDLDEILADPQVQLVAAAGIPCERCALGLRVMDAGKDYFCDKPPLTTLEQVALVKAQVKKTGRKYMVNYSERLHVECAVYAGLLIQSGAIGTVLQVIGLGPHSLRKSSRPEWFFQREKYGGILCDIGSHQIEQYLYYSGATDAQITYARVANYHNPDHPELNDFGDCALLGNNGTTNYFRVDWFSPPGLSSWGDGRTIILGTEGYLELRKNCNITQSATPDHIYLVDGEGEIYIPVHGKVGYPFFGQLILDCMHRTETAMTQAHALKAAELCIRAQIAAEAQEKK